MTGPAAIAKGQPVLSIEHIAVHFGGLVAISDMNFVVNEGEVVSLIGPNGAGKTTAFNVITGFLRPTQGEVRYRGTSLNNLKPHEVTSLGLARTFQRTSVFQTVSVFENVMIGLHRRGRSRLWDTLLALPRERESEAELRTRAARNPGAGRHRAAVARDGGRRSPMASSGCSASRWRWRRILRCCCSTSRCRA